MSYAVDLLIALICSIVAVLQIMQVKTTLVYSRYIGADGQPLPTEIVNDPAPLDPDFNLQVEVYMTKSTSPHCAPPAEDGWKRDNDRLPTVRSYVDAGFGLILAAAAIGLVLGGLMPTAPIAWMLFAVVAVEFVVDLRRLIEMLVGGQVTLLAFIPQGIMAVGLLAAYRLV